MFTDILYVMTATDPARAILYRRVSTDEQADSGLGLADQAKRLEAAAIMHDWTVVASNEVEDAGYSAGSLKRPGIQRALTMLATGEADLLAVMKLDRLSRSVHDFADLLKRSQAEGWSLVVLDLGVDTSKPSGRLVANVMMSVAEWERDEIKDRTKRAMARLKADGARLGRPVLVPEDVRERIADARSAGESFGAIAGALNTEGVPTPSGGKWFPASVRSVCQSVHHDLVTEARRAQNARALTATPQPTPQ